MLLAALTVGAVERGINVFRGELLSSNKPVMELMKELDPGLTIRVDGTITRIEARLPTEVPRPDDLEALRHAPANQLLRLAARGVEFKSPMPGH